MLGFPTETLEEIQATLSYAIKSPLSHAHFFAVVPQPNTPIYNLAMQESEAATIGMANDERTSGDYLSPKTWYSRAYGHDLHSQIRNSFIRFYFYPPRVMRLMRAYSIINLSTGFWFILKSMAKSIPVTLSRIIQPGKKWSSD